MKILSLALVLLAVGAVASPAYTRFPALIPDAVVFTAEGDLWKAPLQGGQAQRLTTHAGAEIHSAVSHDGKWLAFSASYEGALEAYVMPMAGGVPKRLSFENGTVNVLGWTAGGEVLLSTQSSTGPSAHRIIAAIHPQSLQRRVFPVADANEAVLDDVGKTLYFTRYGLHLTGDNARKYRGGANARLWRFDLQAKSEAQPLFPDDGSNYKRPMWWKNQLYFVSDKGGAYNLYTTSHGGGMLALTAHKDWEVRNPSLGDGKIVYQLGADLRVLDLAAKQDQLLKIDLLSDFDQQRQRQIKSPLDNLTHMQLAAKEERTLFTARGRLTIAGLGLQRRVDLPVPDGARASEAVFSHDDKSVYALVDTTGENEIWQFAANGSGKGERLTQDGGVHRWAIYPSPDGKWLAHSDKRGRLWLLDLQSKSNGVIDDASVLGIDRHDAVVWSPDSKTLAIVRPNSNQQREQIGLYSLETKRLAFVSSDRYESASPVFSADGRWLYFISNRNFQVSNRSPWGDRNMGPVFDKRGGIYALALQAGNRFPFKADDELVKPEADAKDDKKTDKKASKPEVKPLPAIQYAGLAERLYELPVPAGNYRDLALDDKFIYFLEQEGDKTNLKTISISKTAPQTELFAAGVKNFQLASDKKHLFYQAAAGGFFIVDAGAKQPSDISKAKIKLDDWSFRSDPRQDWQQMFADAWRMHRDFLFDDKIRGVAWLKMREKYAPLVDRVSDRAELNDVLGMMAAEIGILHSQVTPGDIRKGVADGVAAGLGAVLLRTQEGYRVEHIYHSEAELPAQRSPLAQADVDVKEGDVITAVNGRKVLEARDISDLLLNQADKQVLLQIKRAKAMHEVIVSPVNMDKQNNLRYGDWEQSRSERVNTVSKGKIGYLHLRAMVAQDIGSFAREFYANINRDGLIIDVRRNNGGNIDSWIIEKLLRKAWAFWASPLRQPYTNMQQTFRGHLVVLVDELTYSDGETFAAGIKALKLAPLVGKRTAGAGVWLSDQNRLADNGMVRAAENGQFAIEDGRWLIEGVGVTPDIEVENLPHATFKGEDQQLEVAISILEKKLKEQPVLPLKPQTITPF
ncbi:S41 family peptidase [Janthinobacterium sp. B9-8]|uniref:S41 family peptidase n=1 Tax=Janthinobacterium sp. B9-8 TaxID=1236179 RepID=UPI00061CDC7C|nr:S41 family peptidase [Janthinobacterium sp. B9-8]AMC34369.1 peptidase S41 [Janthinobacterium sp. B9-8]